MQIASKSVDHTRWPEGHFAGADKTIRIWDLASGEQLFTMRGHQSIISIFCILPDGRRLVSSSIEDFSVKVWDIETGKQSYSLRGIRIRYRDSQSLRWTFCRDGIRR